EPFSVHTRWIETEFDNTITPYEGAVEAAEPAERERITVEVGGKRLEVVLPAGLGPSGSGSWGSGWGATGSGPARKAAPRRSGGGAKKAAASGDSLVSPMQGTIVKVVVADGDAVEPGDTIVVLEAMKMEQPLTAHKGGTITGLAAAVGQTVTAGAVLCEIKDA
ncbi:biotin/lipoyl-containing protein, partial [Microbispora hainanensis]|uniref:biotin/lipoyl-containing protein n=2 Tax=Microbispora TaxID=2005 RepID=UPI0033F25E94